MIAIPYSTIIVQQSILWYKPETIHPPFCKMNAANLLLSTLSDG